MSFIRRIIRRVKNENNNSGPGSRELAILLGCMLCFFAALADDESCVKSHYSPEVLSDPCSEAMRRRAPDAFSMKWPTQYGEFTAKCVRARAPVWVDRVYNLAKNGYYNDNYFFRVVPNKYVQFGTDGHPPVSNIYNWSSTTNPECAILEPQPPEMPFCMVNNSREEACIEEDVGLSNTFGTLAMSTSYNETYPGYPQGVTWNATAELFINIGNNNTHLDANLFVPICTINDDGMEVVMSFPSFGEISDLGGPGPSLGLLYQDGNSYIKANSSWDTMAESSRVSVCSKNQESSSSVAVGATNIMLIGLGVLVAFHIS